MSEPDDGVENKNKEVVEPPVSAEPASPNLWQRINAVREEIRAVAKDKTIGDGNFAYDVTTHDAINTELRPLMAKQGLVDYLGSHEVEVVDTGIKYGKQDRLRPLLQHRGEYRYIIVNCDDPDDRLEIPATGWGEDAGDKGPGKASTYAFKEARKKLFSISSSKDGEESRINEENIHPPEYERLSARDIDEILVLADDLFDEKADYAIKQMVEKVFNLTHIADIPADQLPIALQRLKNTAKREEKKAADAAKSPVAKPKKKVEDVTKSHEEE